MTEYLEFVKNWPVPKTRNEIRIFLGKTGYYRRFIFNYAQIAKPLFEKLVKDGVHDKQEFTPSPELKKSFETLKKALISAPILA